MTPEPEGLHAAVSAGVLASDEAQTRLLQSIVDVARAIFAAKASSITLFDEETEELVFEAVAGEGADELVGTRFPAGTGIAGYVLRAREPLMLDDVTQDPRFARDVAEDTGYVPEALMAAPLLLEEDALGVLTVLDRNPGQRSSLADMDLLALFAGQAAIALDIVQSARRAKRLLARSGGDVARVARLAAALDALDGERREAGSRLLAALEHVLTPPR